MGRSDCKRVCGCEHRFQTMKRWRETTTNIPEDYLPPGFEVKFDLRRKARYVAGGHLTKTPMSLTYSSVVSRESVCTAFLIAALNGLEIWTADIQNAYLNATTKERVWFEAGDEWGEHAGKPVLIVRALYGLKGSGLAWRNFLSDTLQNKLGFSSCLANLVDQM